MAKRGRRPKNAAGPDRAAGTSNDAGEVQRSIARKLPEGGKHLHPPCRPPSDPAETPPPLTPPDGPGTPAEPRDGQPPLQPAHGDPGPHDPRHESVARLARAVFGEPVDERELLELVEALIAPTFARVAANWHAPWNAEEAHQDFWAWLLEHELQPLFVFRGASPGQFRKFLEVIAIRFANRRLGQWAKARRREQKSLAGHPPPVPYGPTEAEVRARIAELEPRLSRDQRELLHELLGDLDAAPRVRNSFSRKVSYNLLRKVIDFLRR